MSSRRLARGAGEILDPELVILSNAAQQPGVAALEQLRSSPQRDQSARAVPSALQLVGHGRAGFRA